MPITVHLDTDIGDDIDDAFCLALILCCPELQLKSVSTVLNDTAERADMCVEMCQAAGVDAKVVAGARGVITRRPIEWAMTRKAYHGPTKSFGSKFDMAETLATLAEARRSCDVLLTIGPLTNLAMSLVADPDVTRFPRYIAMAGEMRQFGHHEWNIRVDAEAAAIVCTAPIQIDFIPWSIGIDTKLSLDERALIDRGTGPVTKVLNAYRNEFKKVDKKQEMFDPMTVVALLHEDWFTWERGQFIVETRGDVTLGQTIWKYDKNGPHRVAVAVDAEKAKAWMFDRLLAGGVVV